MNSSSCRSVLWNGNSGGLGHITRVFRCCRPVTNTFWLPVRNFESANPAIRSITCDLDARTGSSVKRSAGLLNLYPNSRHNGICHSAGEIIFCIIAGIFEANIRYICACWQVGFEHIFRKGNICNGCGGSVDRPYCHFLCLGIQKKGKHTEQQE